MNIAATKASMRHLYLYTYLLLEEVKKKGRPIRLEWANIPTANIGPDPKDENGLLLQLSHMAVTGSDEDATLLRALIAHEILCHGNNTDFSVKPGAGLVGMISGRLEDPRGELLALQRFPGSKKVIREGIEILTKRGLFSGPDPQRQYHPAEILCGWLTTELRAELLDQTCLEQFGQDFRKLAIETFGTKLVNAIKAEALKGAHARNTQETVDTASRIVKLIEERKEEAEQETSEPETDQQGDQDGDVDNVEPPPAPAAEDSQTADSNTDKSDEQDDADGKGAGNSSTDGNDKGEDGELDSAGNDSGVGNNGAENAAGNDGGEDSQAHGSPGTDAGETGADASEPFEPSSDALQAALNDLLEAEQADGGSYAKGLEDLLCEGNEAMALAKATGGSHTKEITERPHNVTPSVQRRAALRSDSRALSASLALRMSDLLESIGQVRRRNSSDGRLRPSRIWKAAIGDLQICRTKTRQEEIDTCVYLLGDESGSMFEVFGEMKRYQAAGRVAMAAGDVLDEANIPFALATFDDKIRQWKGFDDDWSRSAACYTPTHQGNTNTDTAVVWSLKKFAGRTESRKILIVFLDGDPGDLDKLNAAIYEANHSFSVEVRFILIGTQHLNDFKNVTAPYGVATTPKELAEAVFGALEAAII
jgi:hypothetical protein